MQKRAFSCQLHGKWGRRSSSNKNVDIARVRLSVQYSYLYTSQKRESRARRKSILADKRPLQRTMDSTSLSKLSPYQLQTLSPGHIRLLYVQPLESYPDVICAIHHTPPIEDDYIAISYTWSQSFPGERRIDIPMVEADEVMVQGRPCLAFGKTPTSCLSVSETLWKMIKAVGLPNEGEAPLRAIWIDQICIDQQNNAEKSAQVKMMHRVYQRAERTIIYLGDPTEDTAQALEGALALAFLSKAEAERIPLWPDDPRYGDRSGTLGAFEWPAIQELPGYKIRYATFVDDRERLPITPFHDFAMDILRRKWFNRTWVLQEIACSKRADFVVGSYTLSWEICVAACQFAVANGFHRRFLNHTITEEIPRIEALREHRRVFMEGAAGREDEQEHHLRITRSAVHRALPELLPQVRFKGVMDPRDKLFAVLNITSDLMIYNQSGQFEHIIDYEASVRTVFIRACELWHAGSKGNLDYHFPGNSVRALSFIDWVLDVPGQDAFNLPSWVPNWVQKGQAAMSVSGPTFAAGTSDDASFEPQVVFPAAAQFQSLEVPLQVRGAMLCTVHKSIPVTAEHGVHSPEKQATAHATALSYFSDPYPTTDLTYVQAWQMALNIENCMETLEAAGRTCKFWEAIGNIPRRRWFGPPRRLRAGDLLSDMHQISMMALYTRTPCLAFNRALIVTPSGFIGLAPETAKPGDEVALIFGGKTPYILRRTSLGRYKILGACYLLGALCGEALDGLPQEKIVDITLV